MIVRDFQDEPKAAYMTEVERWRALPGGGERIYHAAATNCRLKEADAYEAARLRPRRCVRRCELTQAPSCTPSGSRRSPTAWSRIFACRMILSKPRSLSAAWRNLLAAHPGYWLSSSIGLNEECTEMFLALEVIQLRLRWCLRFSGGVGGVLWPLREEISAIASHRFRGTLLLVSTPLLLLGNQ